MQTLAFAPTHLRQTSQQKRVKLVYIISDLSIGGAEMMLHKLLTETDRRRFEPVVISLVDSGSLRTRIESLGIAVHTVKMKPGVPSPMGFWRLVRLLRRLKPDLVSGWMYHSCLAAQLASFFLPSRTRVVWNIHYSCDSLSAEKKLTAAVIKACAWLSKRASQIIFVSRASQLQHKPLGYNVDRSCVIPNGINVSDFVASTEARSSLRAELGIADDALLIGTMGRYHPIKDHANFLQAAALLSENYPEANFVLIGQGIDDQNANLLEMIRERGLLQRTYLLGQRDDIPRLAAALDIFSLSSYSESCPNVIGEAMACGVACAVTDVGDAASIVGETGRVVPSRNPRAMAEAWTSLIEVGPKGRLALGRAARSRVIERYRLELVVERYEALYTTILAEARSDHFARATPEFADVSNLSATFDNSGAQ